MFTYLANSTYTSHNLLLSNKYIYKIFQKQSFLSKIKYTYYDQCDQKRTLEGKPGLSESESARVQIQYRQIQWSPQVPDLLLTNSIKQLPGAFLVYQRPLAGTLFVRLQIVIISGRGPRGSPVLNQRMNLTEWSCQAHYGRGK